MAMCASLGLPYAMLGIFRVANVIDVRLREGVSADQSTVQVFHLLFRCTARVKYGLYMFGFDICCRVVGDCIGITGV